MRVYKFSLQRQLKFYNKWSRALLKIKLVIYEEVLCHLMLGKQAKESLVTTFDEEQLSASRCLGTIKQQN